jgi:carbonic anhydrase
MSIDNIIEGYRRFRRGRYAEQRELYRKLEDRGQSPKILFIACCDSRVDPATIFDVAPGEVFVVRNVANIVPPYTPDGQHHGTSAALEFAVRKLQVEHIVVMGHVQCGGAKALLEYADMAESSSENFDFISTWLSIARPARYRMLARALDPEERERDIEQQIVRMSIENLFSFHWVRERVEAGKLELHGLYFGIAEGKLYKLDAYSGAFVLVPE